MTITRREFVAAGAAAALVSQFAWGSEAAVAAGVFDHRLSSMGMEKNSGVCAGERLRGD